MDMSRARPTGWMVMLGLLLAGCSESGGTEAGIDANLDTTAACTLGCQRRVALHCRNDFGQAACQNDCTGVVATLPQPCREPYRVLVSCTAHGTFSCDSSGRARPTGCSTEAAAVDACLASQQDATVD
jgi:hypothetical protein